MNVTTLDTIAFSPELLHCFLHIFPAAMKEHMDWRMRGDGYEQQGRTKNSRGKLNMQALYQLTASATPQAFQTPGQPPIGLTAIQQLVQSGVSPVLLQQIQAAQQQQLAAVSAALAPKHFYTVRHAVTQSRRAAKTHRARGVKLRVHSLRFSHRSPQRRFV
uniref:DUF1738 domain-containing protein n=1 Tax=Ascaris lumbricoides TaxID=6252 RepID=A0A0M3HSH5_ASCLU